MFLGDNKKRRISFSAFLEMRITEHNYKKLSNRITYAYYTITIHSYSIHYGSLYINVMIRSEKLIN